MNKVTLAKSAKAYAKGIGQVAGFVYLFRSVAEGWSADEAPASGWVPGVVRYSLTDGGFTKATGGNAQDGAERWGQAA